MNLIRKAVTALGGIFLAALLIAALAPKAARGIAATLVQVANTTSNPVPNQDVQQPAHHVFTASCTSSLTNGSIATCSAGAVPAGEEFVIETISFEGAADATNTRLVPSFSVISAGSAEVVTLSSIGDDGLLQPRASEFEVTQAARLYADPGFSPNCLVQTKGSNLTVGILFTCTISGYTVSVP
jgi:hypothetical protein